MMEDRLSLPLQLAYKAHHNFSSHIQTNLTSNNLSLQTTKWKVRKSYMLKVICVADEEKIMTF